MREYFITQSSLAELLGNLNEDVRTFFKQEIKLVEKEMSEKVSKLCRDAMILGIGNFMAGAGSILLLASLGFLLAFAFQTTGLNMFLAVFLGFFIIGLLVTIVGAAISVKGIKALSKDSLAPQRTIHAVTGSETPLAGGKEPSAAELYREALATKKRIGEEGQELKHRMDPAQLKKRAIEHIRTHPLSWSIVALAGVLTGSYFFGRRFRRA
jgi:hypothetical protein